MSHLISVEEALTRILAQIRPLEVEPSPLLDALERVLTEDIIAESDIPPFDNSAMDGYAVVAADTVAPPVTLRVTGEIAAGDTCDGQRVEPGTAMRIMTGAPVPSGADAVIRFEQTSEFSTSGRRRGLVHAASVDVVATVQPGDNIRHAAEDVQGGSTVLRAGAVLRPQEIGMLAALGCATVNVHRRPRVAILATGDELVAIDEPVAPGKIRNVNEWTTAALTRRPNSASGAGSCVTSARSMCRDPRRRRDAPVSRASS